MLSFWNGGGIIHVISNENLVNLGTKTQKIPGQSKPVIYTSLPKKEGSPQLILSGIKKSMSKTLRTDTMAWPGLFFNSTAFLLSCGRTQGKCLLWLPPRKIDIIIIIIKNFFFSIWKHRKNDHLKILLSSLQDRLCPKIAECMARENMRHKNL